MLWCYDVVIEALQQGGFLFHNHCKGLGDKRKEDGETKRTLFGLVGVTLEVAKRSNFACHVGRHVYFLRQIISIQMPARGKSVIVG